MGVVAKVAKAQVGPSPSKYGLSLELPLSSLVQGLCVPEERHEAQESYVGMLSEVFEGIMAKLQDDVKFASAEVARVEGSKSGLESKVMESEAALQAAETRAAECKVMLADSTKTVLACKAALGDKERLQKEGDAAFEAAKAEKAALEEALSQDFRLLRDGEVEGEVAGTHYKKLEGLVSNIGLETSLMTALPTCMIKKPADRGSFDAMVVAQLQDKLSTRISDLAEIIQSGQPSAAARQEAVDTARQDLDAAKQAQQEAAEGLKAATDLRQECESQKATAALNVEQHEPELSAAKKTMVEKEMERDAFQGYNFACFKNLQKRRTDTKTTQMSAAREQLEVAAALEMAEAGA